MTSTAALVVVSGAVLLAGSLFVRTLVARRSLRRRIEVLAVRLGAGDSLPGRGAEAALAHLERAAGHAQEVVTDARASATLLSRALDAVSQGVLVCDEQGQAVYRNEHLSRLLGQDSGPLVGGMVDELAGATGHDQVLTRRLELPGPIPRTLRVDAAAVDDGRRTIGVVAVVRDVSSDHEALWARRDLLADARDELAVPASTIRTLAEVLLDQGGESATRQLAARIHTNASSLAQVVEDLIRLHRAEIEPPRSLRTVTVSALVDQALARVRDEARQRDVSVESAPGPEEMSVAGDRTQLVAALSHLVRAALESSPEGSCVQVRPARAEQFAEITVEDNRAAPLPADLVPSGVWPRVDFGDGQGRATGLGLSMARMVAESHGGSVDVRSPEQGGVTLVLRLPVAAPVTALSA